ncbi:MAG: TerB family tellurite resistance protein [Enterobacterales bacterium]|nr:TerB family tellurite resistance protein [Enterobacterales bacterium]
MLKSIRSFIKQIRPDSSQQDQTNALETAVAVLFIEMSRIDGQIEQKELARINQLLDQEFDLPLEQKQALIELAEEHLDKATDYYQFTSQINQSFTPDQKTLLMQNLWQIAFSDGNLSPHEDHYLRKICSLLHLSPPKIYKD